MKKLWKILSYVLVAALASAITMGIGAVQNAVDTSKLDRLGDLIDERFIGETDRTVMEDAAAVAMVDSLGDRWSYYIPASQYGAYKEQMNNAYVGIGITIQATEDDSGILIVKVDEKGPAMEAGLQTQDVIIAVDGRSVIGLNTSEIGEYVRGEVGSWVDITVRRAGEELTIPVQRRTVEVTVATGQLLEGNIGLVTIANFDSRCAAETVDQIEALLEQGAEKLIFDVRFNPGGYAKELVKILDFLLPEGELFRTVDYAGREQVDYSEADCLEIPMAVLVNADSYSAAEFFAAALRDYDAAVIVGEQTVGKGYFQNTFSLGDGSAVGLSVGKYFTPKGESLADVGVTPDVIVEVDRETLAAIYAGTLDPMKDPQILAAIDALK